MTTSIPTITTDRINNSRTIKSYALSTRAYKSLFILGFHAEQASIRKVGEDCYIDEDVAFFLYKRLLNKTVSDALLNDKVRVLLELNDINQITKTRFR